MSDPFYVGYYPRAPKGLAKKISAVTLIVVLSVLAAGLLLALRQPSFASSRFEFGEYRGYAGRLETWPVPMLLTERGRYLLVAPGKHGLAVPDSLSGRSVSLRGSRIERGSDRMIEVQPASMRADT